MSGSPLLIDLPEAITTERLLIRPAAPGDGAALNEAVLETWDSLSRWMPWARERPTLAASEELARTFRANFILRTDLPLLIFLADGQRFVGCTGLTRMSWPVPRFETGYWVRRSCQGQGYAAEAVRALSRLAFGRLGAQRVEIHCSHRNEASQRVALRCGFTLEGRLRNYDREPTGELCDILVYSLVPDDEAARALAAT
ncbi:MAG TPA: GNAT family N-acetyltransferase [Polyangiaceae bacterium]|nr:GNAT family N-acetyltransferase [Polyangiaceae bacterium]